MHYPSYFKKSADHTTLNGVKSQENKPNVLNIKKGYEQDQDAYVIKGTDSYEVKQMKEKMKIVMQKLATARKQKQETQKENQLLQKQIITLRNNVRHMIPGFNNTSSNFPMSNEIITKLLEFYKYDCLDRFFENLCPEELSMKGVIYFYHYSFSQINKILEDYFQDTFELIKKTGCFESLEGPIMNVLRKSYQTTFQKILRKIVQKEQLLVIAESLIKKLSLCSEQKQVLEQVLKLFLQKLLELCIYCKVSDPPFNMQIESIGKKIKYNSIFNDPLDGFIKNKEQCWVVLPEIRKSQNQQIVVKSLVLRTDYFDLGDDEEDENQTEQ